jgi:multimeric flavodoxin WrbA
LSYSDIFPDTTKHADVSTELKAVIDRAGMVAMANGSMFRRKVGAAVVAVRRGGAVHVFDSINHFFFISQMVAPGSSYWNFGFGLEKGDANNDEEGVKTMRVLGENMAWLMKKIHA